MHHQKYDLGTRIGILLGTMIGLCACVLLLRGADLGGVLIASVYLLWEAAGISLFVFFIYLMWKVLKLVVRILRAV